MKKIGWIGTWVMGHAMVQHIIDAGYEVYLWNRTKSKTADLVAKWATFCETIWELTQKSDIIFSIIWDPKNVENVYFWENNIFLPTYMRNYEEARRSYRFSADRPRAPKRAKELDQRYASNAEFCRGHNILCKIHRNMWQRAIKNDYVELRRSFLAFCALMCTQNRNYDII